MKTCVILQPFYIPWKGVFDLINSADEFVLYDTVRYTEHSWINRNKIKTNQGVQWLQIPVTTSGRFNQSICEAKIADYRWTKSHPKSLIGNYSKTAFFKEYFQLFEQLYAECAEEEYISRVNKRFIELICKILDIRTTIRCSSELQLGTGKNERLIEICKQLECDRYISGPAAKNYIETKQFEDAQIELQWMDYSGYPEYPQKFGVFEPGVSVIDLIFNTGKNAPHYIWGWRNKN